MAATTPLEDSAAPSPALPEDPWVPGRSSPAWTAPGAGRTRFYEMDHPEPHRDRAKRILDAHPEVRELFARNPWSAALVLGVVGGQIALAWGLQASGAPWWAVLLVAWLVGAFANHALWVLIHEAAHNLFFEKKWVNQALGMICNLPLVVPSAESFRIYHLKHHQYQGDYLLDADVPSEWEARLFGSSFFGKLMWELLFPIIQSLRTIRFARAKKISFWTPGVITNAVVQFAFDIAIFALVGPMAFLYLALSFLFSIGPHPLGARWVQEHYITEPGQETFSYYGPLNVVALNVGYHNEHHDFPFVAWNNLPRLKALAPEAYDGLVSHRSWLGLWVRFLTDRNITFFSRAIRDGNINRRRQARSRDTYAPDTLDEDGSGTATA